MGFFSSLTSCSDPWLFCRSSALPVSSASSLSLSRQPVPALRPRYRRSRPLCYDTGFHQVHGHRGLEVREDPWLPSRSRGGRRWKRLLGAFLSSSGGHGTRPCRRSFLCRVFLRVPTHTAQVTRPHTRAANPHSAGHTTTHSGTVPMNGREQTQELLLRGHATTNLGTVSTNGREQTQELHWKGHPTTRSGTVPQNGREQTQELHLSKVPFTLPYFLTSTSETSCW